MDRDKAGVSRKQKELNSEQPKISVFYCEELLDVAHVTYFSYFISFDPHNHLEDEILFHPSYR